jgi:hypothetical protein
MWHSEIGYLGKPKRTTTFIETATFEQQLANWRSLGINKRNQLLFLSWDEIVMYYEALQKKAKEKGVVLPESEAWHLISTESPKVAEQKKGLIAMILSSTIH